MSKAHFKELSIIFVFSYAYWNYKTEFSIAMNMLENGSLKADPLVTHTFPLDKINEAFETAMNKKVSHAVKVMIISQ